MDQLGERTATPPVVLGFQALPSRSFK